MCKVNHGSQSANLCSVRSNLHHFLGCSYFLVSESKNTQCFFSSASSPVLIWSLLFFCVFEKIIFRKRTLRFYTSTSVSFPSWLYKDMSLGPFVLFSFFPFLPFWSSLYSFRTLVSLAYKSTLVVISAMHILRNFNSPCLKTKSP